VVALRALGEASPLLVGVSREVDAVLADCIQVNLGDVVEFLRRLEPIAKSAQVMTVVSQSELAKVSLNLKMLEEIDDCRVDMTRGLDCRCHTFTLSQPATRYNHPESTGSWL